jgi:RNA recognition motif-containing protein
MFAKQENKKDTKTKAMHPTTVFVKKLPTTFQKSTLEQLFSHCGPILEVKMQPAVSKKGVEWMTALVQFHEPSAVEEALKLHGQPLDGSDPGKVRMAGLRVCSAVLLTIDFVSARYICGAFPVSCTGGGFASRKVRTLQ